MKRSFNHKSCEHASLKTSKQELQRLASDFADINRRTAMCVSHYFSSASHPDNFYKNRYSDVKPSDHSRVELVQLPHQPGSDYINASFIDEKYISCQAPLPSTFGDFWRMVWETNTSMIVMLTNLNERGNVKAHKYWPEDEYDTLSLDGLEIRLIQAQNLGAIIERSFSISKGQSTENIITRKVIHLQYTHWPDQGTPNSTIDICHLIDLHDVPRVGKTIVHCSAGIGRSGSFIAAEILLEKMKKKIEELQKKKDDGHRQTVECVEFEENTASLTPLVMLKMIVERLRGQRRGMVQTEDQYKFVYQIFKDKLSVQWGHVYMLQRLERFDEFDIEKNGPEKKNSFAEENVNRSPAQPIFLVSQNQPVRPPIVVR